MEGCHSVVSSNKKWIEQELSRCEFKDLRHGKRLEKLLGQFSDEIGGSIPWACQDWANTKAAYRFLANGRVDEAAILSGHFQATRERFSAAQGKDPILVLHDTTEFSYQRERTEGQRGFPKSLVYPRGPEAACRFFLQLPSDHALIRPRHRVRPELKSAT
jgi:hypothetical protein